MKCPCCGCGNIAGVDECENCCTCLAHEDTPLDTAQTRVEFALHNETVAALEPTVPACVFEWSSLNDAICAMKKLSIGCLLVTDASAKLVGILSERDLLYRVADGFADLRNCVDQFMTRAPETVRPDHPLGHALYLMAVGDYRHLPLVDKAGRPTGIISSRDLISFLEDHLDDIVQPRLTHASTWR